MRPSASVTPFLFALLALILTGPAASAAMDDAGHLNVIHVDDYGAVPDDDQEDTVAVRNALAACRNVANPVLQFGTGTYDFRRDPPSGRPVLMLFVEDFENLVVDGAGATLRYNELVLPFYIRDCTNITFRNITIDWKRPPFSVGEVIKVGSDFLDVRIQPQFPVAGGEAVQAYMEYDLVAGRPQPDGHDSTPPVSGTELIAPQVLRLHSPGGVRVRTGDHIVIRHQIYAYNAFQVMFSNNITLRDVTVHTAPGMAFYGHDSRDITLERLRVAPPPGSNRIMSTTADATHFYACQGTITIRDCYFEGMGDDGCNVKGLYLTTEQRVNSRTVIAQHFLDVPAQPRVGDVLEFSHASDLIPYASRTVASVVAYVGGGKHQVTFEADLPGDFRTGDLLANVTRMPKLRVDNLTVRNNRARGMLIQTRDALVENSTFDHNTHAGILVLTESAYFYESAGTRNVTLRNNTFLNAGYFKRHAHMGAIGVYAWLSNYRMPPRPGVHRNIVIEGNRIDRALNSAIFMAGTDGFEIRNNDIEGTCYDPTHPSGNKAVYIMSSANGNIFDNDMDVDRQEPPCVDEFFLGPDNLEETIFYDGDRASHLHVW